MSANPWASYTQYAGNSSIQSPPSTGPHSPATEQGDEHHPQTYPSMSNGMYPTSYAYPQPRYQYPSGYQTGQAYSAQQTSQGAWGAQLGYYSTAITIPSILPTTTAATISSTVPIPYSAATTITPFYQPNLPPHYPTPSSFSSPSGYSSSNPLQAQEGNTQSFRDTSASAQTYPYGGYYYGTAGSATATGAWAAGESSVRESDAADKEKKYACPQCTSKFSRKADRDRHLECVHNKMTSKRFNCPVPTCSRREAGGFTRKDHLTEHLRNYHHQDIPKRRRTRDEDEGGSA